MTQSSPLLPPASATAASAAPDSTFAPFPSSPHGPARPPIFPALVAITAVWLYFLIFTEFAFVDIARLITGATGLKPFLAVLGLAGVAGSFTAALFSAPAIGRWQLFGGFAACTVSAGLAWLAQTPSLFLISAALVGFSLSWTTVVLSLCLRPTLHSRRLGLWCGLSVGVAYAISNQPFFLESVASTKILLALVAALCGLAASLYLRSEPARKSSSPDYAAFGAVTWIGLFLVLVSLDFAAFYIIEHNSALYVKSWESSFVLEGNTFVHLCVALLTGVALDRRLPAFSVTCALALLIGSCFLLNGYSRHFPSARVLYTAGVSIYATALVYFPARGGRPWFSGSLFAIAGWLGSILGLGLALSFRQIPPDILQVAAALGVLMLFGRSLWLRSREAAMLERAT